MPWADPRKVPGLAECMFCGEVVDTYKAWRQVVGLVRSRDAGGVNHILDQRDTGRYSCHDCADKLRNGIHPMQQPLWAR